jgi:hypothetical protein
VVRPPLWPLEKKYKKKKIIVGFWPLEVAEPPPRAMGVVRPPPMAKKKKKKEKKNYKRDFGVLALGLATPKGQTLL